MKNWTKRKILMVKMLFTFLSPNGGEKRAELIRKSGLFHEFGENNYWHPLRVPAEVYAVSFGNNVTVSADVDFVTHDLSYRLFDYSGGVFDTSQEEIKYYFDKIQVDDNVMIGAHSVIMYGVHIKSNTVIAAGSVVTKDVEEGTIVGGNPARVIGSTQQLFEKRLSKQRGRNVSNCDKAEIDRLFWSDTE